MTSPSLDQYLQLSPKERALQNSLYWEKLMDPQHIAFLAALLEMSIRGASRTTKRLPSRSTYSTRQFDQCEMLDNVIYDFRDCDIKLVRIGARKNFIEVWRKVWDRERPKKAPKKFQDIGIAPMKENVGINDHQQSEPDTG